MTNNVILSICIPSYNRGAKIYNQISQIFNIYQEQNIEIVVIDNCSTDDTIKVLTQISDPRLRIIKRKENIGGQGNILSAFTFGIGKYSLLCLDKDFILPEKLLTFVEKLKSLDDNVSFGLLKQNIKDTEIDIYKKQGFETLKFFGYNCEHPSGMFVNTEKLRKTEIVETLLSSNINFPFTVDIIQAHLSMLGCGCKISIPLIVTESLETAKNQYSYTYKGTNIWFFPNNVVHRFHIFVEDCKGLKLNQRQLFFLIKKLYITHLWAMTLGYRRYMSNKKLCSHYNIATKKIGVIDILKYHNIFLLTFMRMSLSLNIFAKSIIVSIGVVLVFPRILFGK